MPYVIIGHWPNSPRHAQDQGTSSLLKRCHLCASDVILAQVTSSWLKWRHPGSSDVILAQVTSSPLSVTSSWLKDVILAQVTSSWLKWRHPGSSDVIPVQVTSSPLSDVITCPPWAGPWAPSAGQSRPACEDLWEKYRSSAGWGGGADSCPPSSRSSSRFETLPTQKKIYSLPRPATLVNWMVYDSRISFSQKTAVFFANQFRGFFTQILVDFRYTILTFPYY
jgi:hypothetical protein